MARPGPKAQSGSREETETALHVLRHARSRFNRNQRVVHAPGAENLVVRTRAQNAGPMWMFPKTRWLMRFVARLLELRAELTPAAATMIAIESFEESFDVDPAEAADNYVKEGPPTTQARG